MGRSVSVPTGAAVVVYADFSGQDSDDWDCTIANLKAELRAVFPSLLPCSTWLDREYHAVLCNNHAHVTVSEYCGLVAVCIVPRGYDYNDPSALAVHWCEQAEARFRKIVAENFGGALVKLGTFSNGEAIFRKAA